MRSFTLLGDVRGGCELGGGPPEPRCLLHEAFQKQNKLDCARQAFCLLGSPARISPVSVTTFMTQKNVSESTVQ